MVSSLRKDSRISGRPIQNATTVVKNTYSSAIQNSAFGIVRPKMGSGPDRLHRIGVNSTTDTMAKTVPNNRVWAVLTVDVFVSGPVPVVNMSMSCWMRWSALSIGLSMNRAR